VDTGHGRFSIDELADLGGVSRRTIRYYIQEGLIPAPLGVGRGRHYDDSHLRRLLEVKAQQEAGLSLLDIRSRRRAGAGALKPDSPASDRAAPVLPKRTSWRRLELAPGVELHLADDIKLPPASQLIDLAAWCRAHLTRNPEGEA